MNPRSIKVSTSPRAGSRNLSGRSLRSEGAGQLADRSCGREGRWVERIREGDHRAFEALFHAYYEDLYGFVRYYVSSSEVVEDLVQDIFLNLWKRRQHWKLEATIKAYLYGAARNTALNHLRHKKVRARWQLSQTAFHAKLVSPSSTDDALRRKELEQEVREAIAELPERRRLVFTLSRHHGLSYKGIATALNISIKTVETQMVRALRFLRERLSTHLPAYYAR